MEQKQQPFIRHGTEEQCIEVSADEILNAIAEGRDVDVEYAVVEGDLDIGKIDQRLEETELGQAEDAKAALKAILTGPVIKGDIAIQYSELHGHVFFNSANFDGSIQFTETVFSRDAQFMKAFFANGAFFHKTAFHGDIYFVDTVFGRSAGFVSAVLGGSVFFEGWLL